MSSKLLISPTLRCGENQEFETDALRALLNCRIICELKAVDEMNPVWEAQLLSHLKLTGKRLGFLINFNVPKAH